MESCNVENCSTPARSLGMCDMHYSRTRRHGDPAVTLKPRSESAAEAFRHYMPGHPPEAPSPTEGCWLWTGTIADTGYGTFSIAGRRYGAHRVAYELFVGPIPDKLFVCHSCDVRSCVQPAHLSPGTQAENLAGMVERGRSRIGAKNHAAKLSVEQVDAIRARYLAGGVSQKVVADEYGITQAQVSRIVAGKRRSKG